MDEVFLPAAIVDELVSHCRSVYPEEGCGLIAFSDSPGLSFRTLPMTNLLHSPVRYQMDPREQFDAIKTMRKEGRALWGIYHSHPMSEPYPSPTDVRLAFYSDCYYLIAGLASDPPTVRCFTIREGRIEEKRLKSLL